MASRRSPPGRPDPPREPRRASGAAGPVEPGATVERHVRAHPVRRALRVQGGGFRLEASDGSDTILVAVDRAGWRLEGPAPLEGARLAREATGGFILHGGSGPEEIGRTTPAVDATAPGLARDVLLADGRVFRLAAVAGRQAGVVVTGWETPGTYLTLRPAGDGGWTIEPMPACGGLDDARVLCVLAAVETLQAAGELENEHDAGSA